MQDMAPSLLVRLDDDGLASTAYRALKSKVMEEALNSHKADGMIDSGLLCGVCGGINTKSSNRAAQRDIGKAETWGSKDRQDDFNVKHMCYDCGECWWT